MRARIVKRDEKSRKEVQEILDNYTEKNLEYNMKNFAIIITKAKDTAKSYIDSILNRKEKI